MKSDFDAALRDHLRAIEERDIGAFVSHLTSQEVLYTIVQNGHAFESRQELIELHAEWFKDRDWIWNGTVLQTVVGQDVAMALVKYDYRRSCAEAPVSSWLTYVFRLEGQEWKIVHDHSTAVDFPAFMRMTERSA